LEKSKPNVNVIRFEIDPETRVMVREDGSIDFLPKDSIPTILPEVQVESPPDNEQSLLFSEQEENVCSQNLYIFKF